MAPPQSHEKPWHKSLVDSFGFAGDPTKWDLSKTVVLALPDGTKAVIHEDVLTTASNYFKTCLSSRFREGHTRTVDCTQLDAKMETIRHMLMLIYGSEAFVFYPIGDKVPFIQDALGLASAIRDTITRVLELYLLADRWMMPKFKDYIVKWIYDLHKPDGTNDVSAASVPNLYYMMTCSPPKSKLRILCRDLLIRAYAMTPPCSWKSHNPSAKSPNHFDPAPEPMCGPFSDFYARAERLWKDAVREDPYFKHWEYRSIGEYYE